MSSVFSKAWIVPDVSGGIAVQWRLFPSNSLTAPYNFYVDRAESAGEWSRLNTGSPVVDDTVYVDTEAPLTHLVTLPDAWYRVVLMQGVTEYESDPITGIGAVSASDWRLVREAVKSQARLISNFTGIPGWLFRRRHLGEHCTLCWDSQLERTANTQCTGCYGTGFTGGFYTGFSFPLLRQKISPLMKDETVMEGFVSNRDMVATSQAVPQVLPEDVWMHGVTGDHYAVKAADVKSAYRGLPVLFELRLSRLDDNDRRRLLAPTGYTAPEVFS